MDTFMDKLAQKLVAQDMIKANSAAEAQELQSTKAQITQYESLLAEIKNLNKMNVESARQVSEIVESGVSRLENTSKVDRLVEESINKIKEMQQAGQNIEELEEKLATLKADLTALFEELTDHVHKENVKVYRNVQAVVVEETAKTNELLTSNVKSLFGRVHAILGVSIAALLLAAGSLTLHLLIYFNVI